MACAVRRNVTTNLVRADHGSPPHCLPLILSHLQVSGQWIMRVGRLWVRLSVRCHGLLQIISTNQNQVLFCVNQSESESESCINVYHLVLDSEAGVHRWWSQLSLALPHSLQGLHGVGLGPLQDGGQVLLLGRQHLLGHWAGSGGDGCQCSRLLLHSHLGVEGRHGRFMQVRVDNVLIHLSSQIRVGRLELLVITEIESMWPETVLLPPCWGCWTRQCHSQCALTLSSPRNRKCLWHEHVVSWDQQTWMEDLKTAN